MKERVLRVCIFLVVIAIAIVGFSVGLQKEKNVSSPDTDALKFKKEYEAYNNQERETDLGNYFQELTISEDNPMKYATVDKVIQILTSGTGILYFGYPTCPWCRNAVPVLLDAALENNVKSIYYLNINDIKNVFEIQDGEIVKTKEEEEGYYELLEALDSILSPYILTDDNGVEYDVGEKRIYVPLVVFVKEGEILGYHVGTVSLEGTQTKYDNLTEEQYWELFDIYSDFIEKISELDYCDEAC